MSESVLRWANNMQRRGRWKLEHRIIISFENRVEVSSITENKGSLRYASHRAFSLSLSLTADIRGIFEAETILRRVRAFATELLLIFRLHNVNSDATTIVAAPVRAT